MSRRLTLLASFILIASAGYQSTVFAAGDAIRWVKVYNTQLNTSIKSSVSVTKFEHQFYSCGEGCQMIQMFADDLHYQGSVIIRLQDSSCPASSATIDIPFTFDDEEIVTPETTYNAELGSTYCHKKQVHAVVTGNPDSVFGYKINLI